MSKYGLAPQRESFVWESPADGYPPQDGSKKSREERDHGCDTAHESSYLDVIDAFIDRFCVRQLKRKIPLKDLMNTIEKVILTKALSRFNGHQKATAQFLKIKPTTLHEKLKKHNIQFHKTVQ
jgi:DNA-binding NtrC family response regulator